MIVNGTAALEVADLHFSYAGVRALQGCSLHVDFGSMTAIVGPNGAGKSTLLEVISGGLAPSSGRVLLAGENVTGVGRLRMARKGLVRSFQVSRQLARLPVIENMMVVGPHQRGETLWAALAGGRIWRRQEGELRTQADDLLRRVGLGETADLVAGSLSGGQRRLLDIALALMAQPKVLLLDEPSAGVAPHMIDRIVEQLLQLPPLGIAVVVVSHDMEFVAALTDDVIAMGRGRVLCRGSLQSVKTNPEVLESYLGG